MSSPQNRLGIKDRLRTAQSEEEIARLLQEGADFRNPSLDTRRGWMRVAKRRRAELGRKTES